MNEISDGTLFPRSHAANVDKGAVAKADLYAVGALGVVSSHHFTEEKAPVPKDEGKALGAVATEGEAVMPEASAEEPNGAGEPPTDRRNGLIPIRDWLAETKAGTAVLLDREEAK